MLTWYGGAVSGPHLSAVLVIAAVASTGCARSHASMPAEDAGPEEAGVPHSDGSSDGGVFITALWTGSLEVSGCDEPESGILIKSVRARLTNTGPPAEILGAGMVLRSTIFSAEAMPDPLIPIEELRFERGEERWVRFTTRWITREESPDGRTGWSSFEPSERLCPVLCERLEAGERFEIELWIDLDVGRVTGAIEPEEQYCARF